MKSRLSKCKSFLIYLKDKDKYVQTGHLVMEDLSDLSIVTKPDSSLNSSTYMWEAANTGFVMQEL